MITDFSGMNISVVLPVYNEEDCLPNLEKELVAALDPIGCKYEVILVNDCSTDKSSEIMEDICKRNSNFRAIHFEVNCGQSAAMAAGFKAARGEFTVTLDADLQNDPADIKKLLELTDEYDCVCGWRQKRNDTWLKRISSKVANRIRNYLSGETITDTGCSLKAYRTEMLQRIYMFRGGHRFLPTLMKMEGASVTELPVNHRPRTLGTSKYGFWNRIFCSFYDLLGVRWMKSRVLGYKVVSEAGNGLPENK
jgi:glycosyltransferase involved in cell wall biosynthesis